MPSRATSVPLVAALLYGDEDAFFDELTRLQADGWSWRKMRDHFLLQTGVAVDSQTYARWYRRRLVSTPSPDAPTVAEAASTADDGEVMASPSPSSALSQSSAGFLHPRPVAEVESPVKDWQAAPSADLEWAS